MRTQHHPPQYHHQLILLSPAGLINCLVIFNALLLNALVHAAVYITGDGAKSCYATNISTCSPKLNSTITFPFLTISPECTNLSSSFVISGCKTNGWPKWPAFNSATSGKDEPPFVMAFYNPFKNAPASTANQIQDLATIGSRQSQGRLDSGYGFINLTWDESLMKQTGCKNATLDQISHSIPDTIDLRLFAHSAFQFSLSNIILLFNCNSASVNSSSYHDVLYKNTAACRSYGSNCNLQEMEKVDCYQYKPYKTLSLPDAMKKSNCTHAMFFSVPNITLANASRWNASLIELNWSTSRTGKDWLASTLDTCVGCLQTKGACGLDDEDDFQCLCADNRLSATNCTVPNADQCKGAFPYCSLGAKIGLAVAAVVVATISFVSLILVAMHHSHKKTEKPDMINLFNYLDLSRLTERPEEFRYALIVYATNSFSSKLGEGGFGKVYMGTLPGDNSGQACIQIAVKVLEVRSNHSKAQFLNEVATIGRIHHVHVVRLLGFCVEDNHEMLVYEYVVNGSLDKWLFNCQSNRRQVLDWDQRYKIALGIAKGLSYLHEECRHRIVHCDIKPQNILLDGQMCPKIADFGLARLMGRDESRVVTLHVKGTPGYMAPEFWMRGESHLSTKSDVYSYGMVLLELMSGHRNFEGTASFPAVAFEAAMRGDFQSIMDIQLGLDMQADHESETADKVRRCQIRTCVFVALWCIQDQPIRRPSMSEVVQFVEGVSVISEQPPRPIFSASTASPMSSQTIASGTHQYQDDTPTCSGR